MNVQIKIYFYKLTLHRANVICLSYSLCFFQVYHKVQVQMGGIAFKSFSLEGVFQLSFPYIRSDIVLGTI